MKLVVFLGGSRAENGNFVSLFFSFVWYVYICFLCVCVSSV